jgi:hypothetical protein
MITSQDAPNLVIDFTRNAFHEKTEQRSLISEQKYADIRDHDNDPNFREDMNTSIIEGVRNPLFPEYLPARWFKDAIISIGEDSTPTVTVGRLPESRLPLVGDDEFVAILRHVHGIGHYFHFMELLITLHAIQAEYLLGARLVRIHVGRQAWNNMRQNGLQLELLRILYPGSFVVENFDGMLSERNVLAVDLDYIFTNINKFLQPVVGIAAAHMPEMRRKVFSACGLAPSGRQPNFPLRVLYVHRNHSRNIDPALLEQLLKWFEDRNYAVTKVDFATMSWKEQVVATHEADLVISAHGNGLTNALWAAPHAAVIELFPDGCHDYAYQLLCEISAVSYLGLQGVAENGFVTRDHCRIGPASGTPRGNVMALPWDALGRFVDGHRIALERS